MTMSNSDLKPSQSELLQHTNCTTNYKFKNYMYIKSVNDEQHYESSGL